MVEGELLIDTDYSKIESISRMHLASRIELLILLKDVEFFSKGEIFALSFDGGEMVTKSIKDYPANVQNEMWRKNHHLLEAIFSSCSETVIYRNERFSKKFDESSIYEIKLSPIPVRRVIYEISTGY